MAATAARASSRLPSLLRRRSPSFSGEYTAGVSSKSKSTCFSGGPLVVYRLSSPLRCLASMLPLHSAIASARLTSVLSSESQSWGLIPLGISMPL